MNSRTENSMAEALTRAALTAGRYRVKVERLALKARERERQLERKQRRTEKAASRTGYRLGLGGAR